MSALENFISFLKQQSIFEIYLPFVLTFSIFYALLKKISIFSKPGDATGGRIEVVIALVAAIYVTIYSPAGIMISQFFSSFFAQSAVWMVVITVFIMIVGMFVTSGLPFGKNNIENAMKKYIGPMIIVGIAITLFTFLTSGGARIFNIGGIGLSEDDIGLIILIGGVALVIVWVTGGFGGKENNQTPAPQVGVPQTG